MVRGWVNAFWSGRPETNDLWGNKRNDKLPSVSGVSGAIDLRLLIRLLFEDISTSTTWLHACIMCVCMPVVSFLTDSYDDNTTDHSGNPDTSVVFCLILFYELLHVMQSVLMPWSHLSLFLSLVFFLLQHGVAGGFSWWQCLCRAACFKGFQWAGFWTALKKHRGETQPQWQQVS